MKNWKRRAARKRVANRRRIWPTCGCCCCGELEGVTVTFSYEYTTFVNSAPIFNALYTFPPGSIKYNGATVEGVLSDDFPMPEGCNDGLLVQPGLTDPAISREARPIASE